MSEIEIARSAAALLVTMRESPIWKDLNGAELAAVLSSASGTVTAAVTMQATQAAIRGVLADGGRGR